MHQSPFPEPRDSFGAGRFVALAIVVVLAVSTIAGGAVSAQATNGSNITTDADDSPLVVSNQSQNQTVYSRASVQFNDQRVEPMSSNSSSTVTVDQVSVPNGGFVSIVGKRQLEEHGLDYYKAGFGNSSYLTPGTHRNVKVTLFETTPKRSVELVAILHNDVDNDHRYEGLMLDKMRNDTEYHTRESGSVVVVNDTATVHPPAAQQATTSNATGTIQAPLVSGDAGTNPTSSAVEETPTETVAAEGGSGGSGRSQADESSGGLLGGNSLLLVVVGLFVGGGVMALLGRMKRKQS